MSWTVVAAIAAAVGGIASAVSAFFTRQAAVAAKETSRDARDALLEATRPHPQVESFERRTESRPEFNVGLFNPTVGRDARDIVIRFKPPGLAPLQGSLDRLVGAVPIQGRLVALDKPADDTGPLSDDILEMTYSDDALLGRYRTVWTTTNTRSGIFITSERIS